MTPDSESEKDPLAREILEYLRRHPRAADSVEGIVRWWLPAQQGATSLSAVRVCLDELTARGLIRRQTLIDGSVIYGARKERN